MSSVDPLAGGINVGALKGLDLETALMMIQSQRANLLEGQLKTQLDIVQDRNAQIAELNKLIGDLKAMRPGGTDPQAWGNLGTTQQGARDMFARLEKSGVNIPKSGDDTVDETNDGSNDKYDARQATFDKWAEELKGKIDSLNSSQQMDMLRMQSLTNKRNEAFDLMTNFIKKMQDSRSSVIGNMR